MSLSAPLPRPCLLAVILVCQTRSGSGPQLVFHWPPDPLGPNSPIAPVDAHDTEDELDSDSDAWSSEDDFYDVTDARVFGQTAFRSSSPLPSQQSKKFLGIDEDGLVGLLTPDRSWNKRKFEISVNDLTFVGRPVFARPDGSWKKVRRSKHVRERSPSSDRDESTEDDAAVNIGGTENEQEQDIDSTRKSNLVMFHLVFVMKPPPLEHAQRVKDMYDNVIKKFARALKWIQAHHSFVSSEIEAIFKLNPQNGNEDEGLSDMTQTVLESSSLAKSIKAVYDAISQSRIASVALLPGVSISLQIPPITSTSYLPALTDPPILPGLWLTTATETNATSKHADDSASIDTTQLSKAYTLLLKSSPNKIAKDAQIVGGPIAAHLPKFVAALRPTKSFFKLANQHKISLTDIQLLARHLIYWRRAIAIPPLSQRDTYIVSPNADLGKLREACKSYESNFPATIPTLPKLLAFLSGIPRPFGTLIPSPDHKDIYMLVLAWLMRNGWVTQLRTFGYIRIDPSVKQQARDRVLDGRASVSQSFGSGGAGSKPEDIPISSRPSFLSRQSSEGRRSLNENNAKFASLVKSPPRATLAESRWLAVLQDNILNDEGTTFAIDDAERQELHAHWPTLSKYLDGITALEIVPTKEGLKRGVVWNLYGKLGLNSGRESKNCVNDDKPVLMTIRHW